MEIPSVNMIGLQFEVPVKPAVSAFTVTDVASEKVIRQVPTPAMAKFNEQFRSMVDIYV